MRFALLGLGWAARALALPALRTLPDVQVVGGCDPSPEQRDSWQRETGLAAFSGLQELVASTRIDAVVVAAPPAFHAPLCIEALELGLHVVCEKPFVADVTEADRVLAAAAAAGKQVAVNHEFRCQPIFETVRSQISNLQYGRLVFCQIWQLMDLAPWDEPAAWRAAMADRALLEGGIHLVDLMLAVFGCPPEAVYARHSPGLEQAREADAIHLLTLEFPDGRLGQITMDRLCQASSRYLELRADCEQASLRASIGGRAAVQIGMKRAERPGIRLDLARGGMAWAEQGTSRHTLARNPPDAPAHATAALLTQIVDAFRDGREPPSSGREARIVLGVIEAAYQSARAGRRVELAEIFEDVGSETIGLR
ncbi:MAG: Gfo/Idh/MocA family protein [Solirubrobacteraceae bacterium]